MKQIVFASVLFFAGFVPSGWAQTKYRIAFNSPENQKTDDYDIYTVNVDGSDVRNVTRDPDVAWTYYSFGGRMFFVSDRGACRRCFHLYESDHEGQNIKRLSNLQLEDSWMGSRRGGSEMVVSGRVGKDVRYQLFIVDLATGRYRQLTNQLSAAYRDPTFSPNGKKIAYVYKKSRADRTEIEELYVMNSDGTQPKKLTTYPANDPMAKEPGYKVGPPHWNSKHDVITYQSEQQGTSSIFAVTPDGKKHWKIDTGTLAAGWHDWSADGEWLAFDAREPVAGRYDIYLMNYATREIKQVTGSSQMKHHQAPVFIEVR